MSANSGLAWLCRTCTKMQRSVISGISVCGARLANKECGSPIFGQSFPLYEGSVTDFTTHCFVCGEKSVQAIGMKPPEGLGIIAYDKTRSRKFGVCAAHGLAFFRRVIEQHHVGDARFTAPREVVKGVEVNSGRGWLPGEEEPYTKMFHELAHEFQEKSQRKYGTLEDHLHEQGFALAEEAPAGQATDPQPDGRDIGGAGDSGSASDS